MPKIIPMQLKLYVDLPSEVQGRLSLAPGRLLSYLHIAFLLVLKQPAWSSSSTVPILWEG